MVSMQGEDEPDCLTDSWTTPCKTISYVITRGYNVVCLNGTFHNMSEYIEIMDNEYVYKEITIVCASCLLDDSEIILKSGFGKTIYISFVNFTITDSRFQLGNIYVTFKRVTLLHVIIEDFENVVNQVHFEESRLECINAEPCGLLLLNNSIAKCVIRDSQLSNYKVDLNIRDLVLVVKDTIILESIIHVRVLSFTYLQIPTFIQFHNVTINPQNMTNHSPHVRKRSVEPVLSDLEIVLHVTNPYIYVSSSNLYRTHLEISSNQEEFHQAYFWGAVTDTKFIDSYHKGDGGALAIDSGVVNSRFLISDCIFTNNTVVKSSNALRGHGGAIYIKSGSMRVEIMNSVFVKNKADFAGLDLYTSEGVAISLTNCSFLYSVNPINPVQGVLAFISGAVTQIQSYFNIIVVNPEYYVGPNSVFYIAKGSHLDITISCPTWYRHNVEYVLSSSGSNTITDIRYACNPCSDNYYTTSETERTLLYAGNNSAINSESSDETGQTGYICSECPYGAICTGNNVLPRPNYWGYWHEGELVFLQCPAGYCCSGSTNSPCEAYNYCEGNKTGTLCGACQEHFSVSILTGNCTPDSNCGNAEWFWLFAVLVALAYALWYTLKDDIFSLFFATVSYIWNFSNRSNKKINVVKPAASNDRKDNVNEIDMPVQDTVENSVTSIDDSEGDVDKGYFGIVTYYVQMAAVIMIQIEFSDIDQSESFIDTMVNNIGRFLNLELTQMSFDVCPIVGLTRLGKHLYSLGFLFAIYICWSFLFVCVSIFTFISNRKNKMEGITTRLHSFKMKLIGGIVEIIKYTYAGFCGLIFMSLACTQLGNDYVWWYDGTNVCLENWQISIIIFAAFYAFPFPFVLVSGLKLLRNNEISAATFVCCCLCPLVALLSILIYKCVKAKKTVQYNEQLPKASETVLPVLQGPFRDDEQNMTVYWEAMISFRRLFITGMTLVGYASVRMKIITVISLIFLIQHIFMKPFLVKTSNYIETLSLLLLSITAVINLLKASLG